MIMMTLMLMSAIILTFTTSWSNIFSISAMILILSATNNHSEMSMWATNNMMNLDNISWALATLSIWISMLMILASTQALNKKKSKMFMFMIILLMTLLFLTFTVNNFIMFFIYFESSLIPIFLLIMGWGYQPERLKASIYLIFYTLTGSLPLLIVLMKVWATTSTLNYAIIMLNINSYLMFMSLIMAFLVKMPMFTVHLWLPKAHVEAPISGSMILAGILLKLGGYGLMRVLPMIKKITNNMNNILVSLSLLSLSIMSALCLRQPDLKALIAYSSVAHMSLIIASLMIYNTWSYLGSLTMMIAHGLCSSGLFCLANINYERLNSRSILVNKGMLNLMPNLTLWWFVLSICNMAAPPSLNLLSEISLMMSILSWSPIMMIILFMGSFLSGCYTIYMFAVSQHGKTISTNIFNQPSSREFMLLFLHWAPINLLILNLEIMYP